MYWILPAPSGRARGASLPSGRHVSQRQLQCSGTGLSSRDRLLPATTFSLVGPPAPDPRPAVPHHRATALIMKASTALRISKVLAAPPPRLARGPRACRESRGSTRSGRAARHPRSTHRDSGRICPAISEETVCEGDSMGASRPTGDRRTRASLQSYSAFSRDGPPR